MDELTIDTPEHVPIALEPAGAGSRFLAVLMDALITTTIAGMVFGIARILTSAGVALAIFITVSFAVPLMWHVWFETRGHGRTPGKRALSLRVVDARGLPVSLHQSLARNIMRVVDFAPAFYGVAAAVSLFDPARRRLGDIVANTLVIREAQPPAYTGQLSSERRHNSLRTPRVLRLIRHRIPMQEREFLLRLCLRADRLAPTARYDLMEEVARYYRSKLAIEEEQISGENLVRDLTAVLFSKESR